MRLALYHCKFFNAGASRTYKILETATRVCHAEGCVAQEAVNWLQSVMQQIDGAPFPDNDPTGANLASALAHAATAPSGEAAATGAADATKADATGAAAATEASASAKADEAAHGEEKDETKEDDQ